MKIKLTWQKTNDCLEFDAINENLVDWFVKICYNKNTKFQLADMITDVPLRAISSEGVIAELNDAIDIINPYMLKFKQAPFEKPTDWNNQFQLNKLHKDWANTRKVLPNLPKMLYKTNKLLFDKYNQCNCHIHLLENSFVYDFRDNENHWRIDNPFKDEFFDWHVCHLSLPYPGHGREAFEKFRNYDEDVYGSDLDNWNNVDSYVNINLVRPYRLHPPQEFLNWCKKYNLVPHHHLIPLGNLSEWNNSLYKARGIIRNNLKIEKNYFVLTIK